VLLNILFGVAISSCTLLDREEPLPAWLVIDSISVQDNPNITEGSVRSDITDAWVFIDDEMIGIYELPTEIPILDEGTHRLLIGPGIKVSTISTLRDNYLFYTAFSSEVTLVPGEKIRLEPSVMYRDEDDQYKYIVVEEFEDSFLELEANTNSDAGIRRTTDDAYVYEGNGSGVIQITDTNESVWIRTSEDFVLPQEGKFVYLEMDYYTEFDLVIGVHINNGPVSDQNVNYLTLKANESGNIEWKKAYIALTDALSEGRNMQSAYIYFLPDLVATSKTEGLVLLDNIKILYQK
jgi:hypothetical protein